MKKNKSRNRTETEKMTGREKDEVDLHAVQQIGLQILSVVAEILNRNNISWFLAYGSCLGAVRHGGFIPWDDDIDIGMLREDYERARSILQKELPKGFTYCDRFNEKDFPYNFAKVRKDGTIYSAAEDMHLNIHHGIGIDIFPFDSCPNDPKVFKKVYRVSKMYRLESDLAHMNYRKGKVIRPFWQLPLIHFAHLFFDTKYLQDKLDQCITAEPVGGNTDAVCSWLGDYADGAKAKREWLTPTVRIQFEGMSMPVPRDYDAYLTALYGDYMIPPPESERRPRHKPQMVVLPDCEDKLTERNE